MIIKSRPGKEVMKNIETCLCVFITLSVCHIREVMGLEGKLSSQQAVVGKLNDIQGRLSE